MPTASYDESEGFELGELAARQLNAIRLKDMGLFGRVLAVIRKRVTAWSPYDDDDEIIRKAIAISRECNHKVYRIKDPLAMQRWRVFFTLLDGRKPPVRRVLAVVEYESREQCYDDMSQPHIGEMKSKMIEAALRGDIKKKR